MVTTSQVELAELHQAILQSEKVRTLCMIVVISMFALLGLFRIVVPMDGTVTFGVFILAVSVIYLVFEIVVLRKWTARFGRVDSLHAGCSPPNWYSSASCRWESCSH